MTTPDKVEKEGMNMPSEFRIFDNLRNQETCLYMQIERSVSIPLMRYLNGDIDEIDPKNMLRRIRKFDEITKIFIKEIEDNEVLSYNSKGLIIRDVKRVLVQALKRDMNKIKAIELEKEYAEIVSSLNKICYQLFSQKAIYGAIPIMDTLKYLRTKLNKLKHRLMLNKGLYYSSKVKTQDINLEIKYIDIISNWFIYQASCSDMSYDKLRERMRKVNVSGTQVSSQLHCLNTYPKHITS